MRRNTGSSNGWGYSISAAANPRAGDSTTAVNRLSGSVVDLSGALVPGDTVHIVATGQSASSSLSVDAVTDAGGHFTVPLGPGTYSITIVADGFDPLLQTVQAGNRPLTLEFRLAITTTSTQLEVRSNEDASTSASDNRSALVLKGEQLDTLSSNDSTLQQQVQAMTGGRGSLYVDGFSGGRFPPEDTIREIRINQKSFSPQYEDLGYGRIEILTKPGSNKLHGNAFSSGSTKDFISLNPYTGAEPPYSCFQPWRSERPNRKGLLSLDADTQPTNQYAGHAVLPKPALTCRF